MTISYDPAEMQQRIFHAACVNIACGLDPERCILFVQTNRFQVRWRICSADARNNHSHRTYLAQLSLNEKRHNLLPLHLLI